MSATTYRLGWLAMLTIVALRVGVGMHFYGEGAKKLKSGKPFSRYFLESAKGPLAPWYQAMIWDRDGRHRLGHQLDEHGNPGLDLQPTIDAWDQFRVQVSDYYGLGEEQRTEAERLVDVRETQLRYYVDSNEEEILEYLNGIERSAANRRDEARQQVHSLYRQTLTIDGEMRANLNDWLKTIDKVWSGLEKDLNGLGEGPSPPLSLMRLERRQFDSVGIDQIIPWFDITVGALLIVGLFTRLAAFAGALFLASVCLSQWPTALGAQPIWYQGIEMLACFALVGLAAGRFAGLDSILHNVRMWCCPPKELSNEQ